MRHDEGPGRGLDPRSMTMPGDAWIVLREARPPRWGGQIRRRHVFARLADRTGAAVFEDEFSDRGLRRAMLGPVLGRLPARLGRRFAGAGRPRLAASEKLREPVLRTIAALTVPTAVAIYDDPIAQAATLGVTLDPDWARTLRRRLVANRDAFRWLVVPTKSFAELAGLPLDRVIVGGNGTDTSTVIPGPWPAEPTIGMVSGAAPGRGIESLAEAVRLVRTTIPGVRLRLWLLASTQATRRYLDELRHSLASATWVRIAEAPYSSLGETLAEASILTIPHPANPYLDTALPVKLFDSLAAGRPLVVTPRLETARVVSEFRVGAVTAGDRPEDIAAALVRLLADPDGLRATGAHARDVARTVFDWRVVGDRIATAVLAREAQAAEAQSPPAVT